MPLIPIVLLLLLVSSPAGLALSQTTLVQANPDAKISYINPVWSPDGRSIAYVAVRYSGSEEWTVGGKDSTIWIATLWSVPEKTDTSLGGLNSHLFVV